MRRCPRRDGNLWCSDKRRRLVSRKGGCVWSCLTDEGLDRTVWLDTSTHIVQGPLMQDTSEAAVLEALARGDRKRALTLLMGLYGKSIYNYCRHMLGHDANAEEAQQTTFAQAFADFGRYQRRSPLRQWLQGIARHRCLDMLKTMRRESKHVEHPETPPDVETNEPSAEEQLHIGSMGKHLAHCLDELDDEVRDAILLRFMEQMSYEEMAQVTGKRAATLQMRVARAMSGLRKCLEASGVTL